MFLKEKQDGTIKAQGCCKLRIQRNYKTKEDSISPTVIQENLMVTCIIDAMEVRNVAVAIIPSDFIHTYIVHRDLIVHVRLCGVLTYLLVNIKLKKFAEKVVLKGEQKVIYAAFKKALYGALIDSLLFWRDLSGALGSWGFDPNP